MKTLQSGKQLPKSEPYNHSSNVPRQRKHPPVTLKNKDLWADGGRSQRSLVFFLVCCAAYLILFFLQPLSGYDGVTRLDIVRIFVSDDTVWRQWWGDGQLPTGVGDRWSVLLVTLLILSVSWLSGRILLDALQVTALLSRLERVLFSVGVGCNLISTYSLAVGLCGGLRSIWSYAVPSVLLIGLGVWRLCIVGPRFAADVDDTQYGPTVDGGDWLSPRWLWLGSPLAIVIVWGAMLPPVDFDVREYHLQVPKEWFQRGHIEYLPHNVYGNMPLGTEALSLPAMAVIPGPRDWWWGALVGKTLIALFSLWSALLLVAAGQRWLSTSAGVAAGLIYLSTPWVCQVSLNGLNDVALGFFLSAALYVTLLWWQSRQLPPTQPANSARSTGLLVLAGWLAGASITCKYTGLIYVVLPLGFLVAAIASSALRDKSAADDPDATDHVSRSQRWIAAARACLLFGLSVFAGGGAWYVKNLLLTGNPMYPLVGQVWPTAGRTAAQCVQWNMAHAVPGYGWTQLIDSARNVTLTSDWLSPILIPAALLALIVGRRRPAIIIVGVMCGYCLASWWLLTHRIDRFWVPMLPLISLLAGAAVTWQTGRAWRALVVLALVSSQLYCLQLATSRVMQVDNRYFVGLEAVGASQLTMQPVHRYFYARQNEPLLILLVGDAEPFDLEVPVLYHTCFDHCMFEALLQGRLADERREALAELGVTHVYVAWSEVERYRATYGFSDYVREDVFLELEEQGVLTVDRQLSRFLGIDPNSSSADQVARQRGRAGGVVYRVLGSLRVE
jgi:hypothetical protein